MQTKGDIEMGRTDAERVEQYRKMGTEWRAGDKHRIYFNRDFAEMLGFNVMYYNSGHIQHVEHSEHGKISNSRFHKIQHGIPCKVWFDFKDCKLYTRTADTRVIDDVERIIGDNPADVICRMLRAEADALEIADA